MISFINQLNALNNRIKNQLQTVNRENDFDIKYKEERSSVCYDPYDFINTSLPYTKVIFSYELNTLCIELDNLNSAYGKASLKTSKEVLEEVMLCNDLIFNDGDWYYYPPIDIERDIALGITSVSHPQRLEDEDIRRILKEAFS